MSSTMFAEVDIQRLIDLFPPKEAQAGQNSLLRSYSGNSLVQSNIVEGRLDDLIGKSNAAIPVSSLPKELGIRDAQWLLTDAGHRNVFFTSDRRTILSKHRQDEIIKQVTTQLDQGGVGLGMIARVCDVGASTLRQIMANSTKIRLTDLEDGRTYSTAYLDSARQRLRKVFSSELNSVVNVSEKCPRLPASWLEKTCREIMADDEDETHGELTVQAGRVIFTPQSVKSQLESQGQQAWDALISRGVESLREHGYFELSLENLSSSSTQKGVKHLEDDVIAEHAREDSRSELVSVPMLDPAEPNVAIQKRYLVTPEVLETRQKALSVRAEKVAEELWISRSSEDLTFDGDVMTKVLATSDSAGVDQAIIAGSHEKVIRSAFEARYVSLQDSAAKELATALQTMFLCPTRLYINGAEGIKDTTLQPRVEEFVRDWIRRELVQDVNAKVKEQRLLANKAATRDFVKFNESIQAARTLEDISTVAAKLVRKQKIEQPDREMLAAAKRAIVTQKIAAMKKMKRGSDLLQNLTWLLLAVSREGLFMSSGKDTSRMIKLYQNNDEAADSARLSELRDLVKEGKDTDKEREEMRVMAQEACLRSGLLAE